MLKKLCDKFSFCKSSFSCYENSGEKKPCIYTKIFLISSLTSLGVFYFAGPKIFSKYIYNNPKVIIDSIENMYKKDQEVGKKESKENSKKFALKILESLDVIYVGSKDAKHSIIYIFDYNCGYCKQQLKEILSLLKKRNDIKIIYYSVPITSNISYLASIVEEYLKIKKGSDFALKYLLQLSNVKEINKTSIESALKSLGISEKLDLIIKNEDARKAIELKHSEIKSIGLMGTPMEILLPNNSVDSIISVPGLSSAEELEKSFE